MKDTFLDMLVLALSTTITLILLEYICKLLKLYPATILYWELLDKANITYIVSKILMPNFENLGFLLLNSTRAGSIPKTLIFVNNIDKAQYITAYLYIRLFLQL